MTLLRFSLYFLGFALLVACLAVILRFFLATVVLGPHFWLLFVIISMITYVAYALSDLGIRKGGELSIYSLMGGFFVKLVVCLGVVMVLIIKYPENKILTALNFFSLYFLFTVFEVICLLRNLRDQNQT